MERTDVAVVGAGAAGLAAADALRRAGFGVVVLEARDRIGGRILTHRDARVPVPIELGAEFVHGEAPETTRLLREAGQAVLDLGGESWERRGAHLHPAREYWPLVDRVLSRIPQDGPDLSLDDWLAKKPGGRSLARGRTLARRFVQGFHAADPARASLRALAAGGEAPTASARCAGRTAGGYDRVPQWLARNLEDLRLRSPVAEIAWTKGSAELEARPLNAPPCRLAARAAVVTVPLGVLQVPAEEPGSLRFRPELPPRTRRALSLLAMGAAVHVAFWFRQAPWEEALAGHALRALADTLGLPHRRLQSLTEAFWSHDWLADPWSRGAYSYALAGGADAARDLAKPIDGTLFLAGEAMDAEGRNGTVEGAIASGLRAARQVKRALARRS
jgi:monoamine oxidase